MLRDASQKQVIQKFSFIQDLTIPQTEKSHARQVNKDIGVEPVLDFTPQSSSTTEEVAESTLSKKDSALITAVQTANIGNNSHSASETSYPGIAEIIKYSGLNYSVSHPPKNPNYLGKILFALASSYCLFAVWWLFGHQGSKFITQMMGGKHVTLSQSEVEFIDYMERSLLSLDRELEAKKSDGGKDKVVYVPVYTPKSHTPTIPPAVVQPQPTPQPEISSIVPAIKIPAPPPLPIPAPVPESTPSSSENVGIVTKPAIEHTLTGILDLGVGKSAALIKVNGQTRRFWQGEEIGSSGWILESITNQTATINARGQIRSIAVGESF